MEIEPWMLLAYLFVGISFFLLMFLWIAPRVTVRRIMAGLASPDGSLIMEAVVLRALEVMDKPVEIPGPADGEGKPTVIKTTLGNQIMGKIGSAVMFHFKQTLFGEKGLMSRDMNALQADGMTSMLPPNMAPYAGMIAPYLKRYPILGVMLTAFMQYQAGKQAQGPQPGTGQNGYGNAGPIPAYRGGL